MAVALIQARQLLAIQAAAKTSDRAIKPYRWVYEQSERDAVDGMGSTSSCPRRGPINHETPDYAFFPCDDIGFLRRREPGLQYSDVADV